MRGVGEGRGVGKVVTKVMFGFLKFVKKKKQQPKKKQKKNVCGGVKGFV